MMPTRCKLTGKVSYPNELEALKAIGRIRTSVNNGRQEVPSDKTECRVYRCGKSRHWHLSSLEIPTVPTVPPNPTDYLRIQAAKARKQREAS